MKTVVYGAELLQRIKSILEASTDQDGSVVVRFDLKNGELSGSMTVIDDAESESTADEFDVSI